MKFKSQLTIAFFAAVNQLNGPLRKQNFTLTGWKGHGLWFVIGGFRSVLCVFVFQGSLLVIVIMIDGSKKTQLWRWLLNLRVPMFVKSAVSFNSHKQLGHLTCAKGKRPFEPLPYPWWQSHRLKQNVKEKHILKCQLKNWLENSNASWGDKTGTKAWPISVRLF